MTTIPTQIAAGAVAGAVGTLAMDLLWYARQRADDGDESFTEWEFAQSAESFDDAGAPAQVAAKAADAVDVDLPDRSAGTATNVVHWLTGMGYGMAYGLFGGRGGVVPGLATGAGAFATSYGVLGALGVYKPIWEYDRETLAKDLSAHLLFGLGTGVVYRALTAATRR